MTHSSIKEETLPADARNPGQAPTGQWELGRLVLALAVMAAVIIGAYVYVM